jgi:hexosaminidase
MIIFSFLIKGNSFRFIVTAKAFDCEYIFTSHFALYKKGLIMIALALLFSGLANAHVSLLFPRPEYLSYQLNSGNSVILTKDQFEIQVVQPSTSKSPVIQSAIQRFPQRLFPDRVYGGNNESVQLAALKSIIVSVDDASGKLNSKTDESYQISVDVDSAKLNAKTVFGVLRGLETFAQLMDFSHSADGKNWFKIDGLPIEIRDEPRFSYRGLLIDTARHYLPLSLILDNLDVMEMNKMNILHWHIVDSQSFPYQSKVFPKLSHKGAFQADHIYNIDQVKKVISEAYLRGIRVIPEFDTPGHTQSWGNAMPEILSHCPEPSEPLDPSNPMTYDVLEKLYKEISEVFMDEYVHLGGDEVDFRCWRKDARIQTYMAENNITSEALLEQEFETKLLDIVGRKLNKKTMVWQEIVDNGLRVRPDTFVNIWKGFDVPAIQRAVGQGLQVVVSGCWYLDQLEWEWDYLYKFDITNFTGTDAEKDLVIGGQASMWGEHVDGANFMSRVWPRASSAAERLWSKTDSFSVKEVEPRLAEFRCRMVQRGIPADSIGPGYCPVELEYTPIDFTSSIQ